MSKPITEQEDWLAAAMERQRQTAGKSPRRSYTVQAEVDRLIAAGPKVTRVQVIAERLDVLRFARADGDRLIYREREIVPVRYKDPHRPWIGVEPA